MEVDAEIGRKLATLRAEAELSQGQLAEVLGVAQQTIAKIEKGSRPLKYTEAMSICAFLGVPVSILSPWSDSEFDTAAAMIGHMLKVEGIQGQLDQMADHLSLTLFLIATWLGSIRRSESPKPDDWVELEKKADALLRETWGEKLDARLTQAVAVHRIEADTQAEAKGHYITLLNEVARDESKA